MFTESSLLKARIDLYNIVANHAKQDYLQAAKRHKKVKQYTLSQETETAKYFYTLVYCNDPEELTTDQEEAIKGFLLPYRLYRTEYLQDAGGKEYFKNSIEKFELVNA